MIWLVTVCRYEEDCDFCALWPAGAAVVDSAAGNWDQMYDYSPH